MIGALDQGFEWIVERKFSRIGRQGFFEHLARPAYGLKRTDCYGPIEARFPREQNIFVGIVAGIDQRLKLILRKYS